jgi:hypothetical protein
VTRHAVLPGAFVAYAAPDGLTYIGEAQELRTDGFVRLQLAGQRYSHHAHERWISELTPQEQARLRRDGAQ